MRLMKSQRCAGRLEIILNGLNEEIEIAKVFPN
jgi:hypothetical protein